MLNRTWRIILLLIVLVLLIWPNLIGVSGSWIALVAAIILLIGEFTCGDKCSTSVSVPVKKRSSRKRRRR
jgi:hypothetical protein